MRKVQLDDVPVGIRLAKAVFTADGKILLESGVKLGKRYIERLRQYHITGIYIDDSASEDVNTGSAVCEQTHLEAKMLVKNVIERYTFTGSLDIERVTRMVDRIIDELLDNENILVNLSGIRSVDDYTFEHSVNVCILSLVMGIGLDYGTQRLRELGIGALLHDIGKLKIPEEILKKPSQLTVEEFQEIKKHTLYGYEILKANKAVSIISSFIALGHHERYDGSGYPLQLKGRNIHGCARIVALADVYDALTSDRVYRRKLRPREVFEYVTSMKYSQFDPDVINSFMKYITAHPSQK